jgi:hypothetical protein
MARPPATRPDARARPIAIAASGRAKKMASGLPSAAAAPATALSVQRPSRANTRARARAASTRLSGYVIEKTKLIGKSDASKALVLATSRGNSRRLTS